MFVQVAQRVRHGSTLTDGNTRDVVALCAALDGLPLAIELTAARAKLMSPAALLSRLNEVLDVSTSDRARDFRQVSLRSTIAWSSTSSVTTTRPCWNGWLFAGVGATFESLAGVLPDDVRDRVDVVDVVFSLVDASLVRVVDDAVDGEPRFGLLDTVKHFLRDRLRDDGEQADAERRHAQYFYDLATRSWAERGRLSSDARVHLSAGLSDSRRRAGPAHRRRRRHVPGRRCPAVTHGSPLRGARHQPAPQRRGHLVERSGTARIRSCRGPRGTQRDPGSLRPRAGAERGLGNVEQLTQQALDLLGGATPSAGDRALPAWVDPLAVTLLALATRCVAFRISGRHEQALSTASQIRDLSRSPGDPAHRWSLEFDYLAALGAGDFADAHRYLEEFLGVVNDDEPDWAYVQDICDLDRREGTQLGPSAGSPVWLRRPSRLETSK